MFLSLSATQLATTQGFHKFSIKTIFLSQPQTKFQSTTGFSNFSDPQRCKKRMEGESNSHKQNRRQRKRPEENEERNKDVNNYYDLTCNCYLRRSAVLFSHWWNKETVLFQFCVPLFWRALYTCSVNKETNRFNNCSYVNYLAPCHWELLLPLVFERESSRLLLNACAILFTLILYNIRNYTTRSDLRSETFWLKIDQCRPKRS